MAQTHCYKCGAWLGRWSVITYCIYCGSTIEENNSNYPPKVQRAGYCDGTNHYTCGHEIAAARRVWPPVIDRPILTRHSRLMLPPMIA
jgi:hypothetical protein